MKHNVSRETLLMIGTIIRFLNCLDRKSTNEILCDDNAFSFLNSIVMKYNANAIEEENRRRVGMLLARNQMEKENIQ